MQFTLICRDKPGALDARLAARDAHMAGINRRKASGEIIDGGALLDESGAMIGSVVLCEFPDRAALDDYLATEIYALKGVWGQIEILPFRRVAWEDAQ